MIATASPIATMAGGALVASSVVTIFLAVLSLSLMIVVVVLIVVSGGCKDCSSSEEFVMLGPSQAPPHSVDPAPHAAIVPTATPEPQQTSTASFEHLVADRRRGPPAAANIPRHRTSRFGAVRKPTEVTV